MKCEKKLSTCQKKFLQKHNFFGSIGTSLRGAPGLHFGALALGTPSASSSSPSAASHPRVIAHRMLLLQRGELLLHLHAVVRRPIAERRGAPGAPSDKETHFNTHAYPYSLQHSGRTTREEGRGQALPQTSASRSSTSVTTGWGTCGSGGPAITSA